jgi:hypothetical protein
MAQRARDHREIPQTEWHDMVRAAEEAFEHQGRAIRGNDPAARAVGRMLDREQMAAMGLARKLAVSAPDRDNPFQHDELRRAFNSERASARSHDHRYERTPEHDRRIGHGDAFAGDAWRDRESGVLRWTTVGADPNRAKPLRKAGQPREMGGPKKEMQKDYGGWER